MPKDSKFSRQENARIYSWSYKTGATLDRQICRPLLGHSISLVADTCLREEHRKGTILSIVVLERRKIENWTEHLLKAVHIGGNDNVRSGELASRSW